MPRSIPLLCLTVSSALFTIAASAPAYAYTVPQDLSALLDPPRSSAPLNYSRRLVPCVDGRDTKISINGFIAYGRCYAKSLEYYPS